MMRLRWTGLGVVLLASGVACEDSGVAAPTETGPAEMTVDASEEWAYVTLAGDGASLVAVGDRAASAEWDVAFFATSVMLNGGAAGPGGVEGHCLCENAGRTDAELMGLTADEELATFEAVTLADVPTDPEAWQSDALAPAIAEWYDYDPTTRVVSASDRVWKVRTASGGAFAKLRVAEVAGATRSHAGTVTLEFAVQPSAGAPLGPVQTLVLDLSGGAIHVDLETASVVGPSDPWDLWLEGYEIRVNGGVSGDGQAGAVVVDDDFDAITDAGDVPAQVYRGDAFGGVFDAHPWYRYNLDGGHQIWPTFDVYVIRDGDAYWKVQLTSYYGPTGDSRQVTFRYAPLE